MTLKMGRALWASFLVMGGCATTKQTMPVEPAPVATEQPAPAPAPGVEKPVSEPKKEGVQPASATAPAVKLPATADEAFEQGRASLEAKDGAAAAALLAHCVTLAPERVDCRWELGWAYWLQGDWERLVAIWEEVEARDPHHPELAERLAQARSSLQAQKKLALQAGPRAAPPVDGRVRLRAVGDVMLGSDFPDAEKNMPPDDGANVLAGVKAVLQDADLTFANVEGPLCDGGTTNKCRKSGNCYAFRSPTRFGKYLQEAGVDLASTANNHSGDFGEECRRQTEQTLDALDIAWSGPPGTVATKMANGVKVGMVAFHTSAACNYLNDTAAAKQLVSAAKSAHDLVVVSFHGGAEGGKALHVPDGREIFFGEDRGDLRRFTRAVIDAGADAVIGHGPHVVRGMEFYKGKLIAYSLGNFATYGQFNLRGPQGLGAVLEVTLDAKGDYVDGRVISTLQEGRGIPRLDEKNQALVLLRELTEQDFPGTGARFDDTGRILGPLPTR